MEALALQILEPARRELTAYLCRMVLRASVAEELVQTTFVRALECAAELPTEPNRARAWLFRVATNLAIDELRRHAGKRELQMSDLRETAESRPPFEARSRDLIGSPETRAIAREHLVACFACVLGRLPERKAAAVLLREVHGFSVDEVAAILDATPGQAKNWLQEGRATLVDSYADSCALVRKEGVCHQCSELQDFMHPDTRGPALATPLSWEARLDAVRERAKAPWSRWHRMLFELLDDAG